MKELVTFLEGSLAGWLAGAGWLADWLAGRKAEAHLCHWSLLILRISMTGSKIVNIIKDVRQK